MFPLLNSKLKRKLLTYSFTHPEESYYVRELASLIQEDPGNLSRELKRLEDEGLSQGAGVVNFDLDLSLGQIVDMLFEKLGHSTPGVIRCHIVGDTNGIVRGIEAGGKEKYPQQTENKKSLLSDHDADLLRKFLRISFKDRFNSFYDSRSLFS